MSNAVSKFVILTAISVMAFTACKSGDNPTPQRQLLDQASEAIAQGHPQLAIALLDSIDRAYASDVETRREVMVLRPKANELLTIEYLQRADSMTAVLEVKYDSISRLMIKVNNPEFVEGYWVARSGRNPAIMSTNGIEGRVSEQGDFYMISSLTPSSLQHHSITLAAGDRTATTGKINYDGELNYRVNGSEIVTYLSASCDTVGRLADNARGTAMTVTFHGDKGDKTLQLTPAQAEGLATAYEFAMTLHAFRTQSMERERLNRQLALARDQQARLAP